MFKFWAAPLTAFSVGLVIGIGLGVFAGDFSFCYKSPSYSSSDRYLFSRPQDPHDPQSSPRPFFRRQFVSPPPSVPR